MLGGKNFGKGQRTTHDEDKDASLCYTDGGTHYLTTTAPGRELWLVPVLGAAVGQQGREGQCTPLSNGKEHQVKDMRQEKVTDGNVWLCLPAGKDHSGLVCPRQL